MKEEKQFLPLGTYIIVKTIDKRESNIVLLDGTKSHDDAKEFILQKRGPDVTIDVRMFDSLILSPDVKAMPAGIDGGDDCYIIDSKFVIGVIR